MKQLSWNDVMSMAMMTELSMSVHVLVTDTGSMFTRNGKWYDDNMLMLNAEISNACYAEVGHLFLDTDLGKLDVEVEMEAGNE